jgi:hypothetical protein
MDRGHAQNARLSIRDDFESQSNATDERELHRKKHHPSRFSTSKGTWIEMMPHSRNAFFHAVFVLALTKMRTSDVSLRYRFARGAPRRYRLLLCPDFV